MGRIRVQILELGSLNLRDVCKVKSGLAKTGRKIFLGSRFTKKSMKYLKNLNFCMFSGFQAVSCTGLHRGPTEMTILLELGEEIVGLTNQSQ